MSTAKARVRVETAPEGGWEWYCPCCVIGLYGLTWKSAIEYAFAHAISERWEHPDNEKSA